MYFSDYSSHRNFDFFENFEAGPIPAFSFDCFFGIDCQKGVFFEVASLESVGAGSRFGSRTVGLGLELLSSQLGNDGFEVEIAAKQDAF